MEQIEAEGVESVDGRMDGRMDGWMATEDENTKFNCNNKGAPNTCSKISPPVATSCYSLTLLITAALLLQLGQ